MKNDEIGSLRRSYDKKKLSRASLADQPLDQFRIWFEEAVEDPGVIEANAMVLATQSEGRLSTRVVLLKAIQEKGLVFYTNYRSRKGLEIEKHAQVALNFWWQNLQRQVRIEGRAELLSSTQSDAYFKARPRGSQLGALISPQSKVIPDRHWLEQKLEQATLEHEKSELTRPQHWGGYIVTPDYYEFWQGRANRLHDRFRYRKDENAIWQIDRIAP